MNNNRKYPDEYKLTSSLMTKIQFLLILVFLVFIWFECSWPKDWFFLSCFSIIGISLLFYILQHVEYAIFNHKGILIVHTKRWGRNKAKREFYIDWKDIKYIRLKTPLSKNSSPVIDIVSRIFGHDYYHPTSLSYGKFASLAKYYSGREDIIYTKSRFRRKRKPFEKDW